MLKIIKVGKNPIEKPNSSGQGYDKDHINNVHNELLKEYGFYYSHSTPIHMRDGSIKIYDTYKYPNVDYSIGSYRHSLDWEGHFGGSGHKKRGTGITELKKFLRTNIARIKKSGSKHPVYVSKNPKRKKRMAVRRKRKVICARKNPFKKGDIVKISAPGLPGHGKTGRILSSHGDHFQIESGPTEHKNYMHPASRLTLAKRNPKRRRVIKAKRNPPVRKRHETMIVGYSAYHDWDRPKSKRYYFNGEGFSRKRSEAKIFSGDGAKIEAKRMLPYLPQGIYAIRVETV